MSSFLGQGATLELDRLEKRFGDRVAVDRVSLTAKSGEFLTLLGPSGSGKTTTLNMIAGFVAPSGGRIMVDGREIEKVPPHRRNIGVVFQHYALFPHMSVFENVAFSLKQRRCRGPEIRSRVSEVLELVGLTGYAKNHPRQLSGGQQQRVALARAIVFRPPLLLMDEPLGALDRRLREQLQLELRRIHQEVGITFVYVTHDQEEALVLSDRIAIFNGGRIEQLDTAETLYNFPQTPFAARFLGESNLIPVARGKRSGEVVVRGLGSTIRCPSTVEVSSDSDLHLLVRPERVRLCAGDLAPIGFNRLQGVVQEIVYLGSLRRIAVGIAPGFVVSVREQAGEWPALAVGEIVHVAWSPDDSTLLEGV